MKELNLVYERGSEPNTIDVCTDEKLFLGKIFSQGVFGDKPTPRKITCNDGRPCVVYTSEVFSGIKDFVVYLNQTTGKTK